MTQNIPTFQLRSQSNIKTQAFSINDVLIQNNPVYQFICEFFYYVFTYAEEISIFLLHLLIYNLFNVSEKIVLQSS